MQSTVSFRCVFFIDLSFNESKKIQINFNKLGAIIKFRLQRGMSIALAFLVIEIIVGKKR
jgi:hypothetical protein